MFAGHRPDQSQSLEGGLWTRLPLMPNPVMAHTALALQDGRYAIFGGYCSIIPDDIPDDVADDTMAVQRYERCQPSAQGYILDVSVAVCRHSSGGGHTAMDRVDAEDRRRWQGVKPLPFAVSDCQLVEHDYHGLLAIFPGDPEETVAVVPISPLNESSDQTGAQLQLLQRGKRISDDNNDTGVGSEQQVEEQDVATIHAQTPGLPSIDTRLLAPHNLKHTIVVLAMP